jgi:hypothetical protein
MSEQVDDEKLRRVARALAEYTVSELQKRSLQQHERKS